MVTVQNQNVIEAVKRQTMLQAVEGTPNQASNMLVAVLNVSDPGIVELVRQERNPGFYGTVTTQNTVTWAQNILEDKFFITQIQLRLKPESGNTYWSRGSLVVQAYGQSHVLCEVEKNVASGRIHTDQVLNFDPPLLIDDRTDIDWTYTSSKRTSLQGSVTGIMIGFNVKDKRANV